jgi:hypothetical protein
MDATSFLQTGRWSAGIDSEQRRQWAKPNRSGEEQYGPHHKCCSRNDSRQPRKEADHDRQ